MFLNIMIITHLNLISITHLNVMIIIHYIACKIVNSYFIKGIRERFTVLTYICIL